MSDIDTAAIRAAINAARWPTGWQILDLCDALDAARAEADDMGRAYEAAGEERTEFWMRLQEASARAQRAEAKAESRGGQVAEYGKRIEHRERRIRELESKLEITEARIAAAMAWCDRYDVSGDYLRDLRRALTGGES